MYVEVANSFSNEYKGWCLDSGATSHMCSQKERFENVSAAKCPQLKLANGESTDIEACGLVPFNPSNKYSANLVNTLYVPELRENLLSVSKICDHGFNILFKKDRAEILRGSNGQIVFTAKRKQDLYHVEESGEFGHVAIGYLQPAHLKLSTRRQIRSINIHQKHFGDPDIGDPCCQLGDTRITSRTRSFL
ncbi:hypothetical protein ACLKA7_005682 [Drosophila subpalustris]